MGNRFSYESCCGCAIIIVVAVIVAAPALLIKTVPPKVWFVALTLLWEILWALLARPRKFTEAFEDRRDKAEFVSGKGVWLVSKEVLELRRCRGAALLARELAPGSLEGVCEALDEKLSAAERVRELLEGVPTEEGSKEAAELAGALDFEGREALLREIERSYMPYARRNAVYIKAAELAEKGRCDEALELVKGIKGFKNSAEIEKYCSSLREVKKGNKTVLWLKWTALSIGFVLLMLILFVW